MRQRAEDETEVQYLKWQTVQLAMQIDYAKAPGVKQLAAEASEGLADQLEQKKQELEAAVAAEAAQIAEENNSGE